MIQAIGFLWKKYQVFTKIPKIVKKNLLIILIAGSNCTWNVFLHISFAWIQTPCINNFLNAKEKQKPIWNPFQTVTYFWEFQIEKNMYFLVLSFSLTVFFVLFWVPKKMEGKLWSTSYYFRLKSTKITMIAFFRSLQQHYNCDVSACTCCSKINFCPKMISGIFCLTFLSVTVLSKYGHCFTLKIEAIKRCQ